jgi:hypothetical protein
MTASAVTRTTPAEKAMLTAEQILARLYELRKDYQDDEEDEHYQALHHAFLFLSYQMEAFKKYVREAAEKEKQ